ncbi:MAG: gliding motility-associated C-terminal domain-containing protein [Parafilimonas sp.]
MDKKVVTRNHKLSNNFLKKTDSNTIFHFAAERVDVNLLHANIDTTNIEIVYKENSSVFNYYSGNTHVANQRLIKKIIFKNIYPGIDWVLYSVGDADQKIKYDFVIHENAVADKIQIRYSGNANVRLNNDSGLSVSSRLGFVEEGKPVIYAKNIGNQIPIAYKLKHNTIQYNIDKRLINKEFTIDPDLVWGTFLHTETSFDGSHGSEVHASDVETDARGNIFVALGCSGKIFFPTVNPGNGAYFSSIYDSINGSDVYMKFNANKVLVWSTYFAGGGHSAQIAINKKGELISASNYYGGNLPYKDNGGFFDSGYFTSSCYLAKFSNNGALLWCTNFNADIFNDITTDDDDNIYITGNSDPSIVPRVNPGNGAYIAPFAYEYCIFISKFDANCNVIWCTPMQSTANGGDVGSRLAIDSYKNIYLLAQTVRSDGYVRLDAGGFYQKGSSLSVLSKFNSSYNLTWSTYLPCDAGDIAADTSGNIYVVGQAYSGQKYPYVDPGNGAYMEPNKGILPGGGNILKFNQKTELTWSTTYYNAQFTSFKYVIFEKFRNLIHVFGYPDGLKNGIPTHNDACNGSYFYSSSQPYTSSLDPLFLTFTTEGKSLYASFNGFPVGAYYFIAEFTVDNKGNLFYIFGQIQESPNGASNFPALKNPGNGAYYEEESNNYTSNASFIMELKPSSLNADTSYTIPENCNCTGSLSVIPYCGSGNYKYQWSRGDTTASIINVCPGNYTVKLTDLNSYSDTTIDFNLPNPKGNVNGASLSSKGEHCNKNDGELFITEIEGGPSPFNYSIKGQPYTTDSVFTNLASGNYFVTVKDNDGCVFSDSASIANIAGPSGITVSAFPTACDKINGKIMVESVQGGTAPFEFSINSNTPASDSSFTNLTDGKYLIRVYDSALCNFEDSVVVNKAQPPDSFETNITDTHCDQSIGSITINKISGGSAPFLYSLDSSNFFSNNTFNNLAEGNGKIIVKDSNGCIASNTFIVQNIAGPKKIIFTKTDALCGSLYGSINFDSVEQGAAPFQYSVNGSGYTSNKLFDKIPVGTTILLTKDAFNCSVTDTTIIQNTDALKIKITPGDTTVCAADKLTFSAFLQSNNDGVQYFWNGSLSPFNTYSATIYSNENVSVLAKDKNGCTANDKIFVQAKYCDSLLVNCILFPAAFTPNHDGLNDLFGAHTAGCEVRNYKLIIYNRWGSIVFKTNDFGKRWDGAVNSIPEPTGTFIYYCEWQDALGVIRKLKGTTTLLR